MDDHKNLDLPRHEYRAEGIKGEPLFGAGWPIGAAALTTIIVGTLFHETSALVYVLGAILGAVLGTLLQHLYR